MEENNDHDIQPEILDQLMLLTRLSRRVIMRMPHLAHASHGGVRLRRVLQSSPGLNARELAEILDIRPSSLSQQLERLEARGEIRRERDEQDSRVSHIFLTELSEAHLNESKAAFQAMHDHISACFTPEEKEQFTALCSKLRHYLSADIGDEAEERCLLGEHGSRGRRGHHRRYHGFDARGPRMHGGRHRGRHCQGEALLEGECGKQTECSCHSQDEDKPQT